MARFPSPRFWINTEILDTPKVKVWKQVFSLLEAQFTKGDTHSELVPQHVSKAVEEARSEIADAIVAIQKLVAHGYDQSAEAGGKL